MPQIVIPFSGFYESYWSDAIDHEIEQLAEWKAEDEDEDLDEDEIKTILNDSLDHAKARGLVAKAYVEAYENFVNEETGLQIALDYESLSSPREYNFTTDRIFCTISAEDVQALWEYVDKAEFDKVCRKHLTSRSGFHSFYDPDYTTWGELEEWDHNQLSMLLEALPECEDWVLAESMEIYSLVDEAVNWPSVKAKILEARLIEEGEI